VEAALEECGGASDNRGEIALGLFDWSQRAGDVWLGSKMNEKREILTEVALNRTLSDATLCLDKRKPFDVLAERPSVQSSRGDWI